LANDVLRVFQTFTMVLQWCGTAAENSYPFSLSTMPNGVKQERTLSACIFRDGQALSDGGDVSDAPEGAKAVTKPQSQNSGARCARCATPLSAARGLDSGAAGAAFRQPRGAAIQSAGSASRGHESEMALNKSCNCLSMSRITPAEGL
jgi:hypothetical protein